MSTITITEAKTLIERAQHDVESILIELQEATGLRVDYIDVNTVATDSNGVRWHRVHIETSIV